LGQEMGRKRKFSSKGWKTKEARSAKRHRAKRIGGPGKPDYERGNVFGEVKNRKTKVTKPEVRKIIEKAQKQGAKKVEIVSSSGFTEPAEEHVARFYRNKVKLLRT